MFLSRADVVIYDNLVSPELLRLAPPKAELIYAGKRGGSEKSIEQSELNAMLIAHARKGRVVVRLKGGDPFIFGRGGEEAEALARAQVEFEVVPGVTSAIAGPAFAGVPLTHREHGSFVAFVTGHEDESKGSSARAVGRAGRGGASRRHDRDPDGDGADARDARSNLAQPDFPMKLRRSPCNGRRRRRRKLSARRCRRWRIYLSAKESARRP